MFGKNDYIYIRMASKGGLGNEYYSVQVTSESDPTGIIVKLGEGQPGMYTNAAYPGELLALGDVSDQGAVDHIKVIDEEVVTFQLRGAGSDIPFKEDIMLDRGEWVGVANCEDNKVGTLEAMNNDLKALDGKLTALYQWWRNGYAEGKDYGDLSSEVALGEAKDKVRESHQKLMLMSYDEKLAPDVNSPSDIVCWTGHSMLNLALLVRLVGPPEWPQPEVHQELLWGGLANQLGNPKFENAQPCPEKWNKDVEYACFTGCRVFGISSDQQPDCYVPFWSGYFPVLSNLHGMLGTCDTIKTGNSDEWTDFVSFLSAGHNVATAWKYAFLSGQDQKYAMLIRTDNVRDRLQRVSGLSGAGPLTRDVPGGDVRYYWYSMPGGADDDRPIVPGDGVPVGGQPSAPVPQGTSGEMMAARDSVKVYQVRPEPLEAGKWASGIQPSCRGGRALWSAPLLGKQPVGFTAEAGAAAAQSFLHSNGGRPQDAELVRLGRMMEASVGNDPSKKPTETCEGLVYTYGHRVDGIPVRDDRIVVGYTSPDKPFFYLRRWHETAAPGETVAIMSADRFLQKVHEGREETSKAKLSLEYRVVVEAPGKTVLKPIWVLADGIRSPRLYDAATGEPLE